MMMNGGYEDKWGVSDDYLAGILSLGKKLINKFSTKMAKKGGMKAIAKGAVKKAGIIRKGISAITAAIPGGTAIDLALSAKDMYDAKKLAKKQEKEYNKEVDRQQKMYDESEAAKALKALYATKPSVKKPIFQYKKATLPKAPARSARQQVATPQQAAIPQFIPAPSASPSIVMSSPGASTPAQSATAPGGINPMVIMGGLGLLAILMMGKK